MTSLHHCNKSHDCENDPVERRMYDKCELLRQSLNRAQREFDRACDELRDYRAGKRRN